MVERMVAGMSEGQAFGSWQHRRGGIRYMLVNLYGGFCSLKALCRFHIFFSLRFSGLVAYNAIYILLTLVLYRNV
jgi:hypothetical protein